MPVATSLEDATAHGGRLLVASRLATSLSRAHSVDGVAGEAVRLLHESFDYYLAVVQRLDPDGLLRVVAGAGPLAEEVTDFLAQEQPVEVGVNGRVARSGRAAMVNDTRLDSDYLHRNPRTDPGSELSLPIPVDGSTWGVMNLEQEEPGAFAEEDLLLAHIVASQVGAAIHRCQLVAELEGAFLATVVSVSWQPGPTRAPVCSTVWPMSCVPGPISTSGCSVTSASIQVVAGSTIVTPESIQCVSTRWL